MSTAHTKTLAERMRPRALDHLVGQDHLLYPGSPLHQLVSGSLAAPSVLLWAPPATGKTSIARIIAATTAKRFAELSATSAGVKDVRAAITAAEKALAQTPPTATVLFIDEIHRFSKSQQDILLPAVEASTVSLIGATTENPSFSINSALRSRALLLRLNPLQDNDVQVILHRAVSAADGLNDLVSLPDSAATLIAQLAQSDARQALTVLELAAGVALAQQPMAPTISTPVPAPEVKPEHVRQVAPTALLRFDHDGDQHYDIVSAFIKAMRGSDPDAALHWMARLIESGEDPRFIARRVLVHASEDVGMADPSAVLVAHAASYAVQTIGLPEARINLAQAVIHIATAPKSNAVVAAINAATEDVNAGRTGAVPAHLRDSHYPGAALLGHGAGYLYPHDYPYGIDPGQNYAPEGVDLAARYYQPKETGPESRIAKIIASVRNLKSTNQTTDL